MKLFFKLATWSTHSTTAPACLGQHKQTGLLCSIQREKLWESATLPNQPVTWVVCGGGTKVWAKEAGKERVLHQQPTGSLQNLQKCGICRVASVEESLFPTDCSVSKPKETLFSQTVTWWNHTLWLCCLGRREEGEVVHRSLLTERNS